MNIRSIRDIIYVNKSGRLNLLRKKVNIIFFYVYDSETDTTIAVPAENLDIEDEQELEFIYDDKVRKVWNAKEEEWYFSIIDVCEVLTDSVDARKYWNKLKQRLSDEGNETVTNCHQLKMKASDGKMRKTDCANTEQLLRIIQSIPSKKAEPFKQWLAKVGAERLDEIVNPERAIKRAVQTYRHKGYSEKWIEERLQIFLQSHGLVNPFRNINSSRDSKKKIYVIT